MKKSVVAIDATLAVAAPAALTAVPAHAEGKNPPCITRTEFKKIHKGQTLTTVKRIVGSAGKVSLSSPPMVIRDFKTCTPFHVSNVGFWSGRVQSKLFI